MSLRKLLLLAVASLTSAASLHAERYALLIGVGRYLNGIHGLDGPTYDVEAVRALLLRNGYHPGTVATLINDQATRPNIVKSLQGMVSKLRAGDHLLFYYSGHGTSAFDKNMQLLSPAIGPDSGALATYDLALTSLPAAVETLVIGRRDLRPILSKVPQGAQALVVLDACYSENSAKSLSIFRSAPTRDLKLEDIIQDRTPTANRLPVSPPPAAVDSEAYPYSNVVALSAASKDQPAIDINAATMASKPDWKTVDGKPHGALTNTLLDALSGHADTNHDGAISYDEMYRYVRRQMEKFPQQPQLLSAAGFPLNESVLGVDPDAKQAVKPAVAASPSAPVARFRVAIEGSDPTLEARLRKLTEIEIVAAPFDLLLRKEGSNWAFYDASGILIQRLSAQSTEAIVTRVEGQGRVAQLRTWSNPRQAFNVRIDAEPVKGDAYDRLRTVFRTGEEVRFRIGTEQPAFLLLLGIDKDGRVTVLFPGPPAREHNLQPANQPIDMVVTATPPAGSEQLKLIAFPRAPVEWGDWACSATSCPSFAPGDPRMSRLMQMLNASTGASETSLRVITQQ